MAEREQDPNAGPNTEVDQRERERELHRAQLEAVRSAFSARAEAATPEPAPDDSEEAARTEYLLARFRADIRRLDVRQRSTARVAAALAVCVVLAAAAFVLQALVGFEGPHVVDEISARSIRADRIAVTRDLRVVDAAGNELAVLGRDLGAVGGSKPVVLALKAQGDPSRQLLRLAASSSGAGVTLEEPSGSSSVSLLSTESGSTVEVRNREQTERLSGDRASELPAVAAGPKATGATPGVAADVPRWTPPRGAAPRGDLPEVREVGHGFLVADLSASPTPEGVEVRGRMVNTTAVVHNGLAFRITLGGASATLTVPKISPGNSTGFQITLPGAAGDSASSAQVEYLGSTVAFQANSTEPVYGRHVEAR